MQSRIWQKMTRLDSRAVLNIARTSKTRWREEVCCWMDAQLHASLPCNLFVWKEPFTSCPEPASLPPLWLKPQIQEDCDDLSGWNKVMPCHVTQQPRVSIGHYEDLVPALIQRSSSGSLFVLHLIFRKLIAPLNDLRRYLKTLPSSVKVAIW